eukprot:COSAG01_NODE_230_length_21075_cov_13.811603_19_plen_73_part_00
MAAREREREREKEPLVNKRISPWEMNHIRVRGRVFKHAGVVLQHFVPLRRHHSSIFVLLLDWNSPNARLGFP